MKKVLLLAVLIISANAFCQKITKNQIDKFTKKRIIETSFEQIVSEKNVLTLMNQGKGNGSIKKSFALSFESVNDSVFLRLKWASDAVVAVATDAKLILLNDKDETFTFKSASYSIAGKGAGATGFYGSAQYGLDLYFYGDVSKLQSQIIKSMRIYTTDGYIDLDINKDKTDLFSKLYALLKEESTKQ